MINNISIGFSGSGGSSRDSPTNMTLLVYYERLRMVFAGEFITEAAFEAENSATGCRHCRRVCGPSTAFGWRLTPLRMTNCREPGTENRELGRENWEERTGNREPETGNWN
jgi:hypothetical protein